MIKMKDLLKESGSEINQNVNKMKGEMLASVKSLTDRYFKINDPGKVNNFSQEVVGEILIILQDYNLA